MGIIADGIETAHDTTHRGTGDDIDGDAGLLQHLQHTDMCHTLRTAATQYDRHLLPALSLLRLRTHLAADQQHHYKKQYSCLHLVYLLVSGCKDTSFFRYAS